MIPPSDSIGKMIQNLRSWDYCKSGSIGTVPNDPRLLSSAAKHATKNVKIANKILDLWELIIIMFIIILLFVFLVDCLYAAKIS